jgi:hypothetical protein
MSADLKAINEELPVRAKKHCTTEGTVTIYGQRSL